MKVAASFLTVLVALTVYVAGHARGSTLARHARDYHLRRAPNPKPSTDSSISHPDIPASNNSRGSLTVPSSSHSTSPTASGLLSRSPDPVDGVVDVTWAGSCGPSKATSQITALSGPNGDIDFLNCGLTSPGGWTPPLIYMENIVTVDLAQVAYIPGSAFTACQDFVPIFEKYGQQHGVPAIILAAFAMQESSCNPNTVGGAGEQGLMQITVDKCGGAPSGNCQDPDYNIGQGAQFFSDTLSSVNGDLLQAIGKYNGWYKGLTYDAATAAAQNGNCHEQNNLDYLHQFLNGWVQNVNAYDNNPPLGKYFNLDSCSN